MSDETVIGGALNVKCVMHNRQWKTGNHSSDGYQIPIYTASIQGKRRRLSKIDDDLPVYVATVGGERVYVDIDCGYEYNQQSGALVIPDYMFRELYLRMVHNPNGMVQYAPQKTGIYEDRQSLWLFLFNTPQATSGVVIRSLLREGKTYYYDLVPISVGRTAGR